MVAETRTLALLGGPNSGKTTFLGALADAVSAGSTKRLRLRGAPQDARALMRLQEPLARGEYPQRTKAERHHLRAPLITRGTGATDVAFDLDVGDYAGEDVERLFVERQGGFSDEWRARAGAAGLLLFVRPGADVRLPTSVRSSPTDAERWAAVKGEVEAEQASEGEGPRARFRYGISAGDEASSPLGPREPVRVPTTLALIEVLQFLRYARDLAPGERPLAGIQRIAVLLSAWDAVGRASRVRGPTRYVADEVALLNDYLWSNYRPTDVMCFGLSATAGDLNDPKHRERYLDDPHGFVEWSMAGGVVHSTRDLTLPLRWALFGDNALEAEEPLGGVVMPEPP